MCSLPLMSFFIPYRSVSSKVGCDTVTGKNKIWLHVGSVSFTVTFSTHCFYSLQGHYNNGLSQGTLHFCLNVKPKCLFSGKHLDPVLLWMDTGSKKLTCLFPEAGHSRRCLQDLWPFYFTIPLPPPLDSIKEPGIQTPIKWWFWDDLSTIFSVSLLSKQIHYSLPQYLVSSEPACHVVSRGSLDLVTLLLSLL